jgi:hypothetical protein
MKKHKHYQQMRAMADGWEVEVQRGNGFWALSSYVVSDESLKYRIAPDKDGWIPWYRQEGARPNLPEGQKVEWEATDGLVGASGVGTLNWNGSTPVARYRLIAEPKNKVKMWQWLMKNSGGYYVPAAYYPDEVKSVKGGVKRLEHTRIEIEVDE